jgi:dihydroxy-acid dehydratase
MKRKLRSNFEHGTSRWAVRRAQWKALGLSDEDMEKPKIAVVNTSSELSSCFSHLDGVAAKMKEAIRAAGGLPFEVRTAAPSDFITSAGHRGGYILPSRDLIVNDIEVAVEGALLDGMVCLASCDKTTPGQIMAAGRLNIPSLMVICGYQRSGEYKGEHVDIEEVFLQAGHVASGGITIKDLTGMSDNAVLGPGVCAGMGTANSMHIVCEALGMSLPGSAPVAANSPRMMEYVRLAGERIVRMVWDDLKPRDILTCESIANAVMTILSLSGSINTVKHLQAIALEAECDVDVYALFEQYADKIPLLAAIRPNGEHLIEELEQAGGARAVMKRLEGFLYKDAMTVSGETVGTILQGVTVNDESIIRTVGNPLSRKPSIVIVRGSLAPAGAIVKLGIADTRLLQFAGVANIYHSREAALDGLAQGKIKPGQVVVLRGMGIKGGPGMAMASALVFALDGAGMSERVAVVTDGQLSGLVNRGLVVGEISPEAAEFGSPLGLVQNGDRISIDVDKRVVDLEVGEAELAARRTRLQLFVSPEEKGWLSIYQRSVQPLSKGAVLRK